MAATIRDARNEASERKPVLIDKIDNDNETIAAVILPNEDGFISILDDKFDFRNVN